jgi:serine/threonine protein kinase
VVQFYKHFEDPENIYIMLENCARKSLVHVLKARHTVTEPETRYYMAQLCEGVEYIHQQHIIHRDLKLGNLFLTASMNVKIGDFGLATRLGQEKKGTICGTPNYISPEVLNKEGHGFQADVWALGCVMYALLVGQPPFETSTLKETYSRIAENHYTVPDSLSRGAGHLIKKLLHPNPKHRPSLPTITADPFFSCGLHPISLAASCCTQAPAFPTQPDIHSLTSSVHSLTLPDGQRQAGFHNANLAPPLRSSPGLHSAPAKKPRSRTRTAALHEAICSALAVMPPVQEGGALQQSKDCPVFITKWIDYSNKYGFGFQLSDKSVGVLFNDTTRISYSADRK